MRMTSHPVAKPHDEDLLRLVAGGDRAALEALYLGYHRRLVRFLSRLTPRHENVEEIINDTFLVVWQHARDFRGASRVSTWIIGIAYRVALKLLRDHDCPHRTQRIDAVPETAVEPMQETELRDWIARALAQLPLEQRITMELAYTLGHSVEEIAAISDAPIGTVKARMFHARAKLRELLPSLGGSGSSDFFNE
jgi:RNA polymerase sigma-70 factor (ECF subfamily)